MPDRHRVLRIIARMNVGGPARQVQALLQHLDTSSFDQRLITGVVQPGEADGLGPLATDPRVTVLDGLGRRVSLVDDFSAYRRLAAEIRAWKPDIVHTHTAKAGVVGRGAAIRAGVPHLVHTFHGHLLHGYFSPVVTRGVAFIEGQLARRTDALAAVGEQVRDDLLAAGVGVPSQYLVVPPGVSAPRFVPRAEARRELGVAPDSKVVVFVGRLTQVKRPDRLLDVAQEVLAAQSGTVFLIAGGGPLEGEFRRRAVGFGEAVRPLGWFQDVGILYGAADLVVLTSDNEGMPVSLIEAAQCGVPAVTTDVGSAREVVKDGVTGLVTGTDAGQLASAVLKLLGDDELRATYGESARARAADQFSGERLARDTGVLYTELLQGSARFGRVRRR